MASLTPPIGNFQKTFFSYAKNVKQLSFFSIVPTDKHTFLILNYSNPLDECKDWPWIWGQIAPSGTMIYAVTVAFEKQTF
jgi:hypothetical protein